ncbi:S-adenosylmethionine:tRNA ribosyltransferase-isomerase [Cyclobacterium qasimii]|uniref:S-adenosylmethionine:tRNA ribosyltransferase-isomerase n=2 Tax=Cyclobacterium qasimii TaxID=1350429 RepID=S7VE50_9BACT|nr:S-adenosylmethionine:tRNA ribosyltransferase-isomerase [Cyclobacterium qasimii]EPR67817.1 S-adenosylmethionine:tRNA ribosyltransferase-isomerase [Cyclobacterium qasimii M12-11B]GEO20401.1 S-adenosylmethionine:tRNA ribosyltransferase-isomerase [Cyclobacterium qasimii]
MRIESAPKLQDYYYELPEEFIAKYPLEQRDKSKLLYYENGTIRHEKFSGIAGLIPENSQLVFNNTKVIPARLHFQKATGARIEIFLLNPILPSSLIQQSMESTGPVTWKCMIGNLKRWKENELLTSQIEIDSITYNLEAKLIDRENRAVELNWNPKDKSFASIVEASGEVPLPPYLNRAAEEGDKLRYQTVYSDKEGAVAAPTAGLHFTDKTLTVLTSKGISLEYLTLHTGAGTFQPIKHDNVIEHPMHSEQMVFSKQNIQNLIAAKGNIIAVGTTSMRSLESLYWFGVNLLLGKSDKFHIEKLDPYHEYSSLPDKNESLKAILDWMEKNELVQLIGTTEIFIFPGYQFKLCNGLVTNFHQPGSTLILLVAAFTHGNWKEIYQEAITNKYRFLSYGDSSLLWNNKLK